MSDNKSYTGKLKLVKTLDLTDSNSYEDVIKMSISNTDVFNPNLLPFMDYEEYFYKNFVISNLNIYQIIDLVEHDPYEALINITHNNDGDGTLSFTTQFYNGGTCLSEMLESGLDKITTMEMENKLINDINDTKNDIDNGNGIRFDDFIKTLDEPQTTYIETPYTIPPENNGCYYTNKGAIYFIDGKWYRYEKYNEVEDFMFPSHWLKEIETKS